MSHTNVRSKYLHRTVLPPPPLPIFKSKKRRAPAVRPPNSYMPLNAAAPPRAAYVSPIPEPLDNCPDREALIDSMRKRDSLRCSSGGGQGVLNRVIFDSDELYEHWKSSGSGSDSGGDSSEDPPIPYYSVTSKADETPVFESRFEGGNLQRVVQVYESEFDLVVRPDLNTNRHTQWFYFSMSNTRAKRYKFNLVNFQKPDSLYNYGMRPLTYSLLNSREKRIGWIRSGYDICYYQNKLSPKEERVGSKPSYTLTFTVDVKRNHDTVYFAYCYPYSYTDMKTDILRLMSMPMYGRHIRRRTLCKTLAGNDCDLLTVSNFDSTSAEIQKRSAIVVTARVHPGEVNSSWMMRGFIHFITGPSSEASLLRDLVVFKIVPMLNPDGVVNGNYRCSLAGLDLNRKFDAPCAMRQPTVYETRCMIEKLTQHRKVELVIDMHGHSRKPNIFMYGCENSKNEELKYRERVLPYMLWDNGSNYFSFKDCSFKMTKGKESCARVVYRKEFGIVNSYTMEASFSGTDFGRRKDWHMAWKDFEIMGEKVGKTMLKFLNPAKRKKAYEAVRSHMARIESEEDAGSDADPASDYSVEEFVSTESESQGGGEVWLGEGEGGDGDLLDSQKKKKKSKKKAKKVPKKRRTSVLSRLKQSKSVESSRMRRGSPPKRRGSMAKVKKRTQSIDVFAGTSSLVDRNRRSAAAAAASLGSASKASSRISKSELARKRIKSINIVAKSAFKVIPSSPTSPKIKAELDENTHEPRASVEVKKKKPFSSVPTSVPSSVVSIKGRMPAEVFHTTKAEHSCGGGTGTAVKRGAQASPSRFSGRAIGYSSFEITLKPQKRVNLYISPAASPSSSKAVYHSRPQSRRNSPSYSPPRSLVRSPVASSSSPVVSRHRSLPSLPINAVEAYVRPANTKRNSTSRAANLDLNAHSPRKNSFLLTGSRTQRSPRFSSKARRLPASGLVDIRDRRLEKILRMKSDIERRLPSSSFDQKRDFSSTEIENGDKMVGTSPSMNPLFSSTKENAVAAFIPTPITSVDIKRAGSLGSSRYVKNSEQRDSSLRPGAGRVQSFRKIKSLGYRRSSPPSSMDEARSRRLQRFRFGETSAHAHAHKTSPARDSEDINVKQILAARTSRIDPVQVQNLRFSELTSRMSTLMRKSELSFDLSCDDDGDSECSAGSDGG